jgi:hypothetical protein
MKYEPSGSQSHDEVLEFEFVCGQGLRHDDLIHAEQSSKFITGRQRQLVASYISRSVNSNEIPQPELVSFRETESLLSALCHIQRRQSILFP